MGFWTEYQRELMPLVWEGGLLKLKKVEQANHRLPPGQGLQLTFTALQGPIKIDVHDRQTGQTGIIAREIATEPGEGEGGTGATWPRVPLLVELISPASATPVQTWTSNEDAESEFPYGHFEHVVDGGPNSPEGTWTCRVTNPTRDKVAGGVLIVEHYFDRVEVPTSDIPMRVLNHAFSIALSALMPSARLAGHFAFVSFNPELREFFDEPEALSDRTISLGGLEATGQVLNVEVGVASGADLLAAMRRRYAEMTETALVDFREIWKAAWEQRVSNSDPVIHARVLATDLSLDIPTPLGDIDLADISNASVEVFCAFNPLLFSTSVLVVSPAEFTGGVADVAESLGVIDEAGEYIEKALTGPIEDVGLFLGRYLGELLVNLVARGNVFLDAKVSGNRWQIRHFRKPAEGVPAGIAPTAPIGVGPIRPPGPAGGGRSITPPSEVGPFVVSGEAVHLTRLDQIETIVVLMMENRSFDHLLGYLQETQGRDYEGIDIHAPFTNPPVPPLISPIPMTRATVLTYPATRIHVSPHHDYANVLRQIAGGQMSGFTADIADRGDPYLAMSYYTDDELPRYYDLAPSFCVCDHWFASHPGPTWPNKFASVMGTIIELDNFELDDPRIGWFTNFTICDLLSQYGITWRYFEGDVAFARLFDAYRLDDRNVIPFDDPNDGFEAFMSSGATSEPRVIFIDPRFIPLRLDIENDDHPPADLSRGQDLVKTIFDALIASPSRWSNTLFVITYDEHGGFYDHVPPPGTPVGPPEYIGKIPPIHSQGAPHLGVRVPAFVISPWVSAGSVCHQVFDHTSIIKTILVRFRDQIAASDLTRFGPRVNAAAHLGVALDQDRPRSDVPEPLKPAPRGVPPTRAVTRFPVTPTPAGRPELDARLAELERDATRAQRAVRNIERIERGVATEMARILTSEPGAGEDPRDFRAALRRAFAPRRG